MSGNTVPAKEVLEANREAALHFCVHDLRVMVETRGIEAVMNALDEATFRKLQNYFSNGFELNV